MQKLCSRTTSWCSSHALGCRKHLVHWCFIVANNLYFFAFSRGGWRIEIGFWRSFGYSKFNTLKNNIFIKPFCSENVLLLCFIFKTFVCFLLDTRLHLFLVFDHSYSRIFGKCMILYFYNGLRYTTPFFEMSVILCCLKNIMCCDTLSKVFFSINDSFFFKLLTKCFSRNNLWVTSFYKIISIYSFVLL